MSEVPEKPFLSSESLERARKENHLEASLAEAVDGPWPVLCQACGGHPIETYSAEWLAEHTEEDLIKAGNIKGLVRYRGDLESGIEVMCARCDGRGTIVE